MATAKVTKSEDAVGRQLLGDVAHSKEHGQHLQIRLLEEAEAWNLEPQLESVWWSSTYISEVRRT